MSVFIGLLANSRFQLIFDVFLCKLGHNEEQLKHLLTVWPTAEIPLHPNHVNFIIIKNKICSKEEIVTKKWSKASLYLRYIAFILPMHNGCCQANNTFATT